jgi:hypothetical protein
MTPAIHPLILMAAIGVIAALVLAVLCCRAGSAARRIVFAFSALACLAPAGLLCAVFYPELFDPRIRTYKAFYRDIQQGMTRADIEALLSRHYPQGGPRLRPRMDETPGRVGFLMNPETSAEPDCEGIFLTIHNGSIVEKRYLAD